VTKLYPGKWSFKKERRVLYPRWSRYQSDTIVLRNEIWWNKLLLQWPMLAICRCACVYRTEHPETVDCFKIISCLTNVIRYKLLTMTHNKTWRIAHILVNGPSTQETGVWQSARDRSVYKKKMLTCFRKATFNLKSVILKSIYYIRIYTHVKTISRRVRTLKIVKDSCLGVTCLRAYSISYQCSHLSVER